MTKQYQWKIGSKKLIFSETFVQFATENFTEKFEELFAYVANEATEDDLLLDKNGNHPNYFHVAKGAEPLVFFTPPGKELKVAENGLWLQAGRQTCKIGRWINSILKPEVVAKFNIVDKDIEDITNILKAWCDDTLRFEVVNGESIREWYHHSNYAEGGGSLNKSCMKDDDNQEFFDVYVEQPEIKMLIATKKDKLYGRALLWDDGNMKLMDRVYTSEDAHVKLFKQWAIENNYYHLEEQKFGVTSYVQGSKSCEASGDGEITIKLSRCYARMPYMDTVRYFYEDGGNGYITNKQPDSSHKTLDSTDGNSGYWEAKVLTDIDGYVKSRDVARCSITGRTFDSRNTIVVDGIIAHPSSLTLPEADEIVPTCLITGERYKKKNMVNSIYHGGLVSKENVQLVKRYNDYVSSALTCEVGEVRELRAECVFSMTMKKRIHKTDAVLVTAPNGNMDFMPKGQEDRFLSQNQTNPYLREQN